MRMRLEAVSPGRGSTQIGSFIIARSTKAAQTLVGNDIELREGALVVASAPVPSNGSGALHIESTTIRNAILVAPQR